MSRYTTQTTARGAETFLLCAGRTVAVFSGAEHVLEAEHVADLLNDNDESRYTLAADSEIGQDLTAQIGSVDAVVCPHCLQQFATEQMSLSPDGSGRYRCGTCRRQFRVRIGASVLGKTWWTEAVK